MLSRYTMLVLAACASKSDPPAISPEAEPAWRQQVLDERKKQDVDFKTELTSPLAGVDRFEPEATSYLTIDGDAVHLSTTKSDATAITFEKGPNAWSWQPASEMAATVGEAKHPVQPGPITEPIVIHASPRFTVVGAYLGTQFILTIFDAKRPVLVNFTALSYWDPDPKFVVRATLEPISPKPIQLTTSRGLQKPFVEIGTLHFRIDGKSLALVAYRAAGETAGDLFVPFRDATSGKESYGAARFLEVPDAKPLVIDFNRASNPLCAVSPAYNCPLPPPANTLAVAITAGERDPHLH
ncbi:MAG: DUF1684 domain-containing protein [Kofleriaceae bacterium]